MEDITTVLTSDPLNVQPCLHAGVIAESAYGGPTGNLICIDCGCLMDVNRKTLSEIPAIPFHARHQATAPLRLPAFTG